MDRPTLVTPRLLIATLTHLASAIGRSERFSLLALKGAALVGREYPAAGRPMADLDILVRPRDVGAVVDALRALGGAPLELPDRQVTLDSYYETPVFVPFGARRLMVDVHTAWAWPDAYPIDYAGVFESGTPHPIEELARAGVGRPCAEHMLIHLALHRLLHRYDGDLRNYQDAAKLLANAPIDPACLQRAARDWGVATAVYVFLRRGAALGELPDASELCRLVAPGSLRSLALRAALDLERSPAMRVRLPSKLETLALYWLHCETARAAVAYPAAYLSRRSRDWLHTRRSRMKRTHGLNDRG